MRSDSPLPEYSLVLAAIVAWSCGLGMTGWALRLGYRAQRCIAESYHARGRAEERSRQGEAEEADKYRTAVNKLMDHGKRSNDEARVKGGWAAIFFFAGVLVAALSLSPRVVGAPAATPEHPAAEAVVE